ncbi:MAG: hypothetical protein ACKVOR_04390 [Flavobacteriales bacterium]
MNNKVYIGIIAVLLGVVGYMAYNINKKEKEIVYINQEKGTVMDEAEGLEIELEAMRMRYDTMTVTNSELMANRDANLAQIEELQKKVKSRNYDIKKLQSEAETLRGIMKNYIYQIDSLNTANKQLAMERDQQTQRAVDAETKGQQLESDLSTSNQMVAKGAQLQAGNFTNTALFERTNGKQVDTEKASKTEMIKTCCTVRKNEIAKPGSRKLYMSVVGPDGKTLSGNTSGLIETGSTETAYSVSREIDYQQQDTDVCIYYMAPDGYTFQKGNYKISIYEAGALIGSSTLVMK